MKILITGAAGMIGRKLADRLVADGTLGGAKIAELTLVDVIAPAERAGFKGKLQNLVADLSKPETAGDLIADRPDVIFHLAGIVSGEAEANFDKGYSVNFDGMRYLLEAIRSEGQRDAYVPRQVFSSSIAVFGAPFPDQIGDEFFTTPLTSYGAQKAMCELMLGDYSRKGFVDGIGLRLPTICIRPGKPNKAASGFFSNILREPLVGQEAVLPVSPDVRHWFASPRSAVGFLLHAATLDTAKLEGRRNLNMPGLSATVGDEIEALRRVAGEDAVRLIRHEPDETIAGMVKSWPASFDAKKAEALGFRADSSMDEVVRAHIEDELSQES